MGFLDRLLRRVESRRSAPRVTEDGFVHAPDIAPEDVGRLQRKGWAGDLPDHGLHGTPPKGWKRHLVAGFGVIPSAGDGNAAPSDISDGERSWGDDSGGGDWGDGGGESAGGS